MNVKLGRGVCSTPAEKLPSALVPKIRASLYERRARYSLKPYVPFVTTVLVVSCTFAARWRRGTGFLSARRAPGGPNAGREPPEQQGVELVRAVMASAMQSVNLIPRPDDRGATLLMLSPPLVADKEVLDELLAGVDVVVGAVDAHVRA